MNEMMTSKQLNNYFGSIAFELGELVSLQQYSASDEEKQTLITEGFANYSTISADIETHIESCCQKTLQSSGLSSADIDAVVVASNSYSYDRTMEGRVQLALDNLGFSNQPVIGINYSLCANFSSALRVADALVDGQRMNHVLVVVADVFPDDFNRIGPNTMHIVSDCVSSCLVSATQQEYEILSIAQSGLYDHTVMRDAPPLPPLQKMQKLVAALTQLKNDTLKHSALETAKTRSMIVENHDSEIMLFVSKVFGLTKEKLQFFGKKDHGHAAASDVLASLALSRSTVDHPINEPLMLFTISPTTTALIAVNCVGSDTSLKGAN